MLGCFQIRRMNLQTRNIEDVTGGQAEQQDRATSGGAVAPIISPDGRYMAFGRRIPEGTQSYKGHVFGPRTALWLRDLQAVEERLLMDPTELGLAGGISSQKVVPPRNGLAADGRA